MKLNRADAYLQMVFYQRQHDNIAKIHVCHLHSVAEISANFIISISNQSVHSKDAKRLSINR